jgi:transcriptional regulator with XRE-family HTH domain
MTGHSKETGPPAKKQSSGPIELPQGAEQAFSARLFDLMRKAGYSRKELAETIGVTRQSVTNWLGGTWPSGEHVVPLARALGVSADYLLAGEDAPEDRDIRADLLEVSALEICQAVEKATKAAVDDVLRRYTRT